MMTVIVNSSITSLPSDYYGNEYKKLPKCAEYVAIAVSKWIEYINTNMHTSIVYGRILAEEIVR